MTKKPVKGPLPARNNAPVVGPGVAEAEEEPRAGHERRHPGSHLLPEEKIARERRPGGKTRQQGVGRQQHHARREDAVHRRAQVAREHVARQPRRPHRRNVRYDDSDIHKNSVLVFE